WGTSIASPLTAGMVAEIDHVLNASGQGNLGFLDPGLYPLANKEFATLAGGATTGYYLTSAYNSSLPTLPLSPVTEGRNLLYTTHYGYSLVTGWGSLDAYNYTMYFLTTDSSGVPGRLSGVQDVLNLAGLNVTSTSSTGRSTRSSTPPSNRTSSLPTAWGPRSIGSRTSSTSLT
ncbi:hypothetical protein B1B_16909, partial [mine drainage metagenome]